MAAFKRYQSKVFWDRMAVDDLRVGGPVGSASPARLDNAGDSERAPSYDSTIEETTTTERRCAADNDGEQEREEEVAKLEGEWASSREDTVLVRSSSVMSQDLRSQDSGFSDSERSDCLGGYEDESPRLRRRRKTRRRSKSKNVHLDLPLPTPAHTSTPKEHGSSRKAAARDSRVRSRECASESEALAGARSSCLSLVNEECLGDFLYAAEPPEDGTTFVKADRSRANRRATYQLDTAATAAAAHTSATRAWLADLASTIENECCATLQGKSLPCGETSQPETPSERPLSTIAAAAASRLLVSADQFDKHHRRVLEEVTLSRERGDWRSSKRLVRGIEDHAFAILSELGAPPPRRIRHASPVPVRQILCQLRDLKNSVDGNLEARLDLYIEKVVRELEDASWKEDSDTAIRGALAALTALGLSGTRAGSSVARCAGVRVLLTLLLSHRPTSSSAVTFERSAKDARAAILRALASVCCSGEAIARFVKDGGPEILAAILAARDLSPESVRTEAAALVVQITAPWTDALGLPHLEPFAGSLIPSLARLAEGTGCGQTLLLSAAALNQLSHSTKCVAVMLEDDTVSKLLRSIRRAAGGNVWLMEQAAALIGQLARFPEARPHLARARASVALVCFLRMRPPGLEHAYRKLEFTAAAALTRLCVDPEIARQVVTVGGADCLPSYGTDIFLDDDGHQATVGLLRYTKSLRRACRRAAEQIDSAMAGYEY